MQCCRMLIFTTISYFISASLVSESRVADVALCDCGVLFTCLVTAASFYDRVLTLPFLAMP